MKRKPANTDIRDFEASLEKLKAVVGLLENGNLTLSESLQRYEEGVKFLAECHEMLNGAQMKIEQLVKLDENGRLITRPFDDTASFEHPSGTQTTGMQAGGATSRSSAGGYSESPESVNLKGKSPRKKSKPPSKVDENDHDQAWDVDDAMTDVEMTADSMHGSNYSPDAPTSHTRRRSRSPDQNSNSQRGFLDFEDEER
jgi:exodeoxyribonuclease VII small subunit